jgi:hypothetical protein
MTVAPGATLADTRRQLVLRAFASTNGDYARTATIVGMTATEVRSEIASLLNGNGGSAGAQSADKPGESVARAGKVAKAPAKAAAAKSKPKKR